MMKKTRKISSRVFGALGLKHLQNESGLMLVLTMVILLVLSSLAATNMINSYLERSLTGNQIHSSVSLNAADAGVDRAITWLIQNEASVPCTDATNTACTGVAPYMNADYCYGGGTPNQPFQTLTGSLPGGGTFTANLRFRCEDDTFYKDNDGLSDTQPEIVMYNRCPPPGAVVPGCWGFQDSVFTAGNPQATPLVEIQSIGRYENAGTRTVNLVVAANGLDIKAFGAVTAASNVNTTGNITIDGRAHDENGVLCDTYAGGTGSCGCTEAYPGVTVEDGMTVNQGGSANPNGDPTADAEVGSVTDPNGDAAFIPANVNEALGLPPGFDVSEFFDGGTLPAAGQTKVSKNGVITYVNDNYTWSLSGTTKGVIIVSNPNFDPEVWKVSTPFVPNPAGGGQIVNPNLDATDPKFDAALNAGYDNTKDPHAQTDAYVQTIMPRNIDQQGNGTHKGVVIADSIDKINGNCNIYGAMISLSTMSVNTLGNGAANIMFSCDAINVGTLQGYSTKLAWQRMFN